MFGYLTRSIRSTDIGTGISGYGESRIGVLWFYLASKLRAGYMTKETKSINGSGKISAKNL
jgi:hypothetical protein